MLPLGTLAANLIGGYLVGVAVAFFAPHLICRRSGDCSRSPGFLGGLTTFSAFSARSRAAAARRYLWRGVGLAAHRRRLALLTCGIALRAALRVALFA